MNIGSLFFDFRGGDASNLMLDAQKAAEAAGVKSGASFSSKFSTAMRGAIGAGAGAAFGLMVQQGAQLDAATQKLAADTGLTGKALSDQGSAIDNMYKHSLLSMDQVEQTLSAVISGLGLSGQAADDMTAKFLKYDEATGQGAESIATMKEITDAYNLSATDQGTIMDLLVASHQKYGTSITEDQAALLAMGPALQGMNMDMTDGVALLNLFETAGISASKAPMALQKAIATLKPGQNLNDLIVQISSIVDPTERAQAAMKIFGARGGAQLAQAFQPGITSLDQFKTSMEDTVGATDRAAQAIEDGWGSRFTLLMHQAGGTLATFGQSFGPLLMVGAQLGPKLAAAIGGIGGLLIEPLKNAILGTLGTATTAAGTVGTAVGAAEAEAELAAKQALAPEDAAAAAATKTPFEVAAAAGVGTVAGEAEVQTESLAIAAGAPEVGAAIASQAPEAAAAGGAIGTAVGGAIAVAIPLALGAAFVIAASKAGDVWSQIHNTIMEHLGLGTDFWQVDQTSAPSQTAGEPDAMRRAQENVQRIAGMTTDAAAAGINAASQYLITTGLAKLEKAADGTFQVIPTTLEERMAEANRDTRVGMAAIVTSVKANQAALTSAWGGALDESIRHQELARQMADNIAEQGNKDLTDRLNSKDEVVRNSAKLELMELQNAYIKMAVEDAQYGTTAEKEAKLTALLQSQALKDGLSSDNPDIRQMWADVQAVTEQQLTALQLDVEAFGKETGLNYADALQTKEIDAAIQAAMDHWRALLPQGFTFDWSSGHPVTTAPWNGPISSGGPSGPPGTTTFPTPPTVQTPSQHPWGWGYASGTPFNETAGFYTVGERGTENVYLPRGAAVEPHGGFGGVNIASGAVQVTAQFGSDVSQSAGLRAAQFIGDKLAEVIQIERSRISGSAS